MNPGRGEGRPAKWAPTTGMSLCLATKRRKVARAQPPLSRVDAPLRLRDVEEENLPVLSGQGRQSVPRLALGQVIALVLGA